MNNACFIGNLTDNPQLRFTANNIPCCYFRLAVPRKFKGANGEKQTDFLDIVAWRQLGELCAKYLTKGRKCGVRGRVEGNTYTARDGSKRYKLEIVADEVEFLSNGQASQSNGAGDTIGNAYSGFAPASPSSSLDGFQEVDDDELPF